MVLGHEVHPGAIPRQDMDLVLRPQLQSVEVDPERPNIPLSVAQSAVGVTPAQACPPDQVTA